MPLGIHLWRRTPGAGIQKYGKVGFARVAGPDEYGHRAQFNLGVDYRAKVLYLDFEAVLRYGGGHVRSRRLFFASLRHCQHLRPFFRRYRLDGKALSTLDDLHISQGGVAFQLVQTDEAR